MEKYTLRMYLADMLLLAVFGDFWVMCMLLRFATKGGES